MYRYKDSLITLLKLDKDTKYHVNYISNLVQDKKLTNHMIKHLYPDFKTCNCSSKTCVINYDSFIKYIKSYLIIDDGTPECDYYFEPNMKPITVNIKDFTFI
jgi:hypothetical protein